MLVSIEEHGNTGKKDLYVSFKIPHTTQKWTTPLSLGENVNTEEDEMTPYLASDNTTLFFSTDGRGGEGGQDVFITTRLDDTWTSWSEPENVGNVVNTAASDAYFVLTNDEESAYFSVGVGTEKADIYTVRIIPEDERKEKSLEKERLMTKMLLKGYIIDGETGDHIPGNIVFSLDDQALDSIQTNDEGYYEISLDKGKDYKLEPSSDGYEPASFTVSIPQIADSTEVERDLPLLPTPDKIDLENVYFDFNKATLRPESFPELDRAYEFLQRYTSVKIQVQGHTDNVGGNAYNLRLSENRAKAVMDYLLQKVLHLKE